MPWPRSAIGALKNWPPLQSYRACVRAKSPAESKANRAPGEADEQRVLVGQYLDLADQFDQPVRPAGVARGPRP